MMPEVQVKLAPRPHADYGDEDKARSKVADAKARAVAMLLSAGTEESPFLVYHRVAEYLGIEGDPRICLYGPKGGSDKQILAPGDED